MSIQWSTYQEVESAARFPLQECLRTFAATQTLQSLLQREPESLILPPAVEREMVWSGMDEERPILVRSVQGWPKNQVSLWTYLAFGLDGLFPWRELERFRWLPPAFFAKTLLVGESYFFGGGFAVLREELSGQPWTVYKTHSREDAAALVQFLQSFGEGAYEILPIHNAEHQYLLSVEGEPERFHIFASYPGDTPKELLEQRVGMYAPRWSGRRVCIFADRVGGEVVA